MTGPRCLPPPTTRTRAGDVIARLRHFHAVGRKSLDDHPHGVGYGGMNAEAARHGLSGEMLRKARAFAAAYSRRELDAACRSAERSG